MNNGHYAELLDEIGDLLQVVGANSFRVRAFQRAARALKGLSAPVDEFLDAGTITDIDGIGKSIAVDLQQMREEGSCTLLDELRDQLPAGITEILKVQGLGPKKVKRLYEELGIGSLTQLEERAESGEIAALKGFGEKGVAKIVAEVARLRAHSGRTPFHRAYFAAQEIRTALAALDAVERVDVAGSLRRGRETVGDLDFVVASATPQPVMDAFIALPNVDEVVATGETKTTVYLRSGISADLRVVPADVYGATLHHFTGSKDHNILMRARAQKRGLRISEWGVFRDDPKADAKDAPDAKGSPIACISEEAVYEAVGLPFIAPELREGRGEIKAAEAGELPHLVELRDIRGDLHMHSTASDGGQSIAEMAAAAAARGLSYIAMTDHSKALTVAGGLDEKRLLKQGEEIDALNETQPGIRVFKGIEADIMQDGSIDLDAEVLETLDWVVGSVHQWMNMEPVAMTDRLVAAVSSGLISAIGHPTGRLIGRRDPFEFDFDAVLDACEAFGVALEVNASPMRLDLNDRMLRRALERPGVYITINTDAHSIRGLDQMHFGVMMARRGWTPSERVLNTHSPEAFLAARRAPKRA